MHRDETPAEECERDARQFEEWYADQQAEESAREDERRCDLRRTFGLPDDTPTTDLW